MSSKNDFFEAIVYAKAKFGENCCNSPDDRMFHAADNTWWKRVGNEWKSAEPPTGWVKRLEPVQFMPGVFMPEIPREISDAARQVEMWFKENGTDIQIITSSPTSLSH